MIHQPKETRATLGVSNNGSGIEAIVIRINNDERFFHLHGGMHGDESEGRDVCLRLLEEVRSGKVLPTMNVVFIPAINPDGLATGTRSNARGVDLNRNFPTENWTATPCDPRYLPGQTPASEPETRSVLTALDRYPPLCVITLHTWKPQVNYDGPPHTEQIARFIASFNNYEVTDYIGYPTPGSFGTYCGIERGIPTITLEMSENSGFELSYHQNGEALRKVLTAEWIASELPHPTKSE